MRRCAFVCREPAIVTIVVAHPTTGPVFTDRCAGHRLDAEYPIVDVLPLGTNLAAIPRPMDRPTRRRLWPAVARWARRTASL